jgi:glycerol uptake facilitator-like aquaporin
MSPGRRVTAECLGTAFLLAAVVGSGIMGEPTPWRRAPRWWS